MEEIIKVEGLWHVYPGGIEALRGVDLTIKRGEFIAIIGQNGSGKTTLVKHFNGLLKPTRGKVYVYGVDTSKASTYELSRKVGYVFQNPDHQIYSDSVYDEVAFGPRNLGFPEDEIKEIVKHVLEELELSEYVDTPPFMLGKGLRQRLAVASILAMKPEVLVVDEPTTGQDWKECVKLVEFMDRLNKEGHTIIMVTHNMKLVSMFAKRVIVMKNGRILLDGPTEQVMYDIETLREAYIKPPDVVLIDFRLRNLLGGKPSLRVEDLAEKIYQACRR